MEYLYNPDMMSEEEIKQTFVARQGLLDELIALIERQPEGAGVQHAVIIGARGMGKTTLLLMVQFAMKDRGLESRWQAIRFPEESYGVNDLADLWISALEYLARDANDCELQQKTKQLQAEYRRSDDLQDAALAALKDWSQRHNRRLVLLLDNFDMILSQINDERANASLRNVLMNDGAIMLIGGATNFFHEARAYDQPLYNFFKIYHLDNLTFEDTLNLLRQRAIADGLTDFETSLQANLRRLRVLHYFTGGNPRLVIMLYRIVTQSEVSDVQCGLESLLDEITPYYKAKIESLPPQQRKILDQIARVSGQTHEGVTPTEIAEATRLTPSGVSSQLKRLSEAGFVRSANVRGRNTYYTLSEPLYAIWHQMRFARNPHLRLGWLVDFLKVYYDAEESGVESKRREKLCREIFEAAAEGCLEFARELVSGANLDEVFFPLVRATDYLLTGDEELIEKLSPEVKKIVEDVVEKLRPAAGRKE